MTGPQQVTIPISQYQNTIATRDRIRVHKDIDASVFSGDLKDVIEYLQGMAGGLEDCIMDTEIWDDHFEIWISGWRAPTAAERVKITAAFDKKVQDAANKKIKDEEAKADAELKEHLEYLRLKEKYENRLSSSDTAATESS